MQIWFFVIITSAVFVNCGYRQMINVSLQYKDYEWKMYKGHIMSWIFKNFPFSHVLGVLHLYHIKYPSFIDSQEGNA